MVSDAELIGNKLKEISEDIDKNIDEYSKNIYGYPETEPFDILYEEYLNYLNSIKQSIDFLIEIINK